MVKGRDSPAANDALGDCAPGCLDIEAATAVVDGVDCVAFFGLKYVVVDVARDVAVVCSGQITGRFSVGSSVCHRGWA